MYHLYIKLFSQSESSPKANTNCVKYNLNGKISLSFNKEIRSLKFDLGLCFYN